MFKNEIRKIFLSYIPIILVVITLATITFMAREYNNNKYHQPDYWATNIEKYETRDEILQKITDINESLDELDPKGEDYEQTRLDLLESKKVYQYVYDNDLKYDEVAQTQGYYEYSNDKISALYDLTTYVTLIIIVVSIVLAIKIVNYEQDIGVAKYIFGGVTNRKKLLTTKLLVYISTVASFTLLCTFLLWFFTKDYPLEYSKILVFDKDNLKTIEVGNYITYMYLSLFTEIIFFSLLIFFITVYFKKVILSLLASMGGIVTMMVIVMFIDNVYVTAIFQFPILIYELDIAFYTIIFNICFKVLLICVLGYGAFTHFNRKDIL